VFIDGWDKIEKKEQIAICKFVNSIPRYSTKVVFTTREMIMMDNTYHYKLEGLNDKDSRKLFWNAIKARSSFFCVSFSVLLIEQKKKKTGDWILQSQKFSILQRN